jgi:hypothetical protein
MTERAAQCVEHINVRLSRAGLQFNCEGDSGLGGGGVQTCETDEALRVRESGALSDMVEQVSRVYGSSDKQGGALAYSRQGGRQGRWAMCRSSLQMLLQSPVN